MGPPDRHVGLEVRAEFDMETVGYLTFTPVRYKFVLGLQPTLLLQSSFVETPPRIERRVLREGRDGAQALLAQGLLERLFRPCRGLGLLDRYLRRVPLVARRTAAVAAAGAAVPGPRLGLALRLEACELLVIPLFVGGGGRLRLLRALGAHGSTRTVASCGGQPRRRVGQPLLESSARRLASVLPVSAAKQAGSSADRFEAPIPRAGPEYASVASASARESRSPAPTGRGGKQLRRRRARGPPLAPVMYNIVTKYAPSAPPSLASKTLGKKCAPSAARVYCRRVAPAPTRAACARRRAKDPRRAE